MSVEIQRGEERFPAHWVVGLMVLPEFRNGLVGPQLIKKVNESLSFAMTLHVEDAVSRIVKGLKWTHLGTIPQYIHVLNGRRLADQLQLERLDFLSSRQGVGMRAIRYWLTSYNTCPYRIGHSDHRKNMDDDSGRRTTALSGSFDH